MTAPSKPSKFDYSKIDNSQKCKETHVVCPVCLEKENKVRMGHKRRHIVFPYEETETEILIANMISYNHFALLKGTQTPATEDARNVFCEVDRVWVNKADETYKSYRLKKK